MSRLWVAEEGGCLQKRVEERSAAEGRSAEEGHELGAGASSTGSRGRNGGPPTDVARQAQTTSGFPLVVSHCRSPMPPGIAALLPATSVVGGK